MTSYRSDRVTRAQRDLLLEITRGLPFNTAVFLHYLISVSLRKWRRHGGNPGYIPVHSKRMIEKHFRGAQWKPLVAPGLGRGTEPGVAPAEREPTPDDQRSTPTPESFDAFFEQAAAQQQALQARQKARAAAVLDVLPYEKGQHAYRFRVRPDIVEAFLKAGLQSVDEALSPGNKRPLVNLATGKPSTALGARSALYDGNRNPYPQHVQAAIKTIKRCPFNDEAIRAHLERLEMEARAHPAIAKAYRRWLIDYACYQTILKQRPRRDANGLWWFTPAYRPQSAGRLTQIGGGLQSCSRAMKGAAYAGIDDVYNYDLADSHARILRTVMGEVGIEPTFLNRYLGADNRKAKAAAFLGFEEHLWKRVFYALFNGARIPNVYMVLTSDQPGSIARAFRAAAQGDRRKLKASYKRFLALVRTLQQEMQAFITHLRMEALSPSPANRNGFVFVTNAAGMKLKLERSHLEGVDALSRGRAERRLLAHALQGREALFIHGLTASAPRYGFEVLANEHDGLVTLGRIPAAAIEEAKAFAALPEARLEEKPFS